MEVLVGMFLLVAVIAIYLTPTLVASSREHNNLGAIAMLNVALGWTFLFWVLALVWSLTNNVKTERL